MIDPKYPPRIITEVVPPSIMSRQERLNSLQTLIAIIRDHARPPSKYRKQNYEAIWDAISTARSLFWKELNVEMAANFPISRLELTPTGIALIESDESRVDLCGKDAWELLKWLNWHIIEVGQRREMEGPTQPVTEEEHPHDQR